MGFIARRHVAPASFTDAIALEALERVVPADLIRAAATAAAVPTARRRKLPADVTLLLCIAMSLFTAPALGVVLHKMVHGLRLFWPDPDIAPASKSAISQARYRLGARPVVGLFHQVCRPLATERTPGAFLWRKPSATPWRSKPSEANDTCLGPDLRSFASSGAEAY